MPRRVALALLIVAGAGAALTPGASARQPSAPARPAVDAAVVLGAGNQATGLAVFRLRDDGTLAFSRGSPMDVSTTRNLFWMVMAP